MARILMPGLADSVAYPDKEIWSFLACSITRRELDVTAKFKCLAKQN